MSSIRKPHNNNAGYIAEKQFGGADGKAHIAIYNAEEAGIDTGQKYAIVCEKHSRMVGATSVPNARRIMKNPDFCEKCIPGAFDPQDCTDRERDYDPIDLSAGFDM